MYPAARVSLDSPVLRVPSASAASPELRVSAPPQGRGASVASLEPPVLAALQELPLLLALARPRVSALSQKQWEPAWVYPYPSYPRRSGKRIPAGSAALELPPGRPA